MFSLVLCIISITYFKSIDVVAVYTRNNLSWSNAEILEDSVVKLDLTNRKTTVRLKNDVKGSIGYNIYLYAEKENSNEVILSAKNMTEINKNEYPNFLKKCDVKCAYRGYLEGNSKKKKEFIEFHRLLAILIYEYNKKRKRFNQPESSALRI